jgi:hypothetical protein
MATAFGLLLAFACITVVAVGFAFACIAWRPRPDGTVITLAIVGGLVTGATCLLLAALHALADLLT